MKILFVTPDIPYPLFNGGKIRTYFLLQHLAKKHDVTLISYDKDPANSTRVDVFKEFCREVIVVPLSKRQTSQEKRKTQFLSMFSAKPYQYYASYSLEMQQAIDQALANQPFDLIHVETAHMGYHHFPSQIPRALDQQNVEYDLLQRIYETEKLSIRKLYTYLEWKKFRRDELNICKQFSLCSVPSQRDKEVFQKSIPATPFEVVPNGVDSSFFQSNGSSEPEESTILFTGSIDYYPNTDGLKFFIESVLPLIRKEVPNIHFIIAGRNPPPVIQQYETDPAITITGFVDDMRTYYNKAQVVVVPLRTGGGTRLKILEAMAMKKPIVSTSVGAEGIAVSPGEDILLADEPSTFAESTVRLLKDPQKRQALANDGHRLATEVYDWQAIAAKLTASYEDLVKLSKPNPMN